jgi:hypothetical protein
VEIITDPAKNFKVIRFTLAINDVANKRSMLPIMKFFSAATILVIDF